MRVEGRTRLTKPRNHKRYPDVIAALVAQERAVASCVARMAYQELMAPMLVRALLHQAMISRLCFKA